VRLQRKELVIIKTVNRTFGWNSICCLWFFGLVVIVPNSKSFGLPVGETLAGSVVLAIMALPTIITISETQCATHRVP
jgi:ABC-type phosphate transport system permease subunit